jgi:hypothetical protein
MVAATDYLFDIATFTPLIGAILVLSLEIASGNARILSNMESDPTFLRVARVGRRADGRLRGRPRAIW